jgi:hypothetical protein
VPLSEEKHKPENLSSGNFASYSSDSVLTFCWYSIRLLVVLTLPLCTGNDEVLNLPIRMTEDLSPNGETLTGETIHLLLLYSSQTFSSIYSAFEFSNWLKDA